LEYERLNNTNSDLHLHRIFNGCGPGTHLFWRGLSGSDDLGWAGITLCLAYQITGRKEYLSSPKKCNGARGAVQFFEEMERGYLDKGEGIFWDKGRTYKASISNSLYMELAGALYEITREERYVEVALETEKWFFSKELNLVSEDFEVLDGYRPA